MAIYFNDEAQYKAAHVINFTRLTNNTRRTLGGSSNNQEMVLVDFGNVDKKLSGSVLVFQGFCAGQGESAGGITLNLKLGATHANYVMSGGTGTGYPICTYNYSGNGYQEFAIVSGSISGYTTTGNSSVIVGYRDAAGNGRKPFGKVNPNASDNSGLENSMGGSSMSIWEINL